MFGIWIRVWGLFRLAPVAVAATRPSRPTRLTEYVGPPSIKKSVTTTPSGNAPSGTGLTVGETVLPDDAGAAVPPECHWLADAADGEPVETGPPLQLITAIASSGVAQRMPWKRRSNLAVTQSPLLGF